MKNLFLLALILLGATQIKAQIKATTESGNTVILYKNGTWEYYEAGMETTTTPSQAAPVTTPAVTSTTPIVTIDASKEATSERFELFYEVSPRMARFFGEEKGKIRCNSTISNQKGQFLISFEINVPVGDANRYFGPSLKERSITFELSNNTKIEIPITEGISEKWMDKWNQSYYVGSGILSNDDVKAIATNPITNVYIDWKKFPENYKVADKTVLQTAVKEVL
nr:hypothetical protein [uncultured Carboxylicivirga sp.]